MQCILCGDPFDDRRAQLGFATCPKCGDIDALTNIEQKHKRIGVAWNKGPEMYLGSPTTTRHILKYEGGRKHLPIDPDSKRDKSIPAPRAIPRGAIEPQPPQQPQPTRWVFSHWRWDTNELGHRVKRAILKKTEKE